MQYIFTFVYRPLPSLRLYLRGLHLAAQEFQAQEWVFISQKTEQKKIIFRDPQDCQVNENFVNIYNC